MSTTQLLKYIVPTCFVVGAGMEAFMIKTGFCEYTRLPSQRMCVCVSACVCGGGGVGRVRVRRVPPRARCDLTPWLAFVLGVLPACCVAYLADTTVLRIESERRAELIEQLNSSIRQRGDDPGTSTGPAAGSSSL
jgi:hypothetical protein